MGVTIETQYTRKAMKALARGLRKTLRAKRSRRSHILGLLAILLGVILVIRDGSLNLRSLLTAAAVVVMVYVLLREDDINGRMAKKRGLPGLNSAVTTFEEECYHSVTALGASTFAYSNIQALAETEEFFLLLYSPNHGQVYDKSGLSGGTEEDLRSFLEEKTGLTFQKI